LLQWSSCLFILLILLLGTHTQTPCILPPSLSLSLSLSVSTSQHVDGAGKVDGSCVVALPMEKDKEFAGGGLTFWDGKTTTKITKNQPDEIHYDTRAGDLAFIDRYVR